MKKLSKEEVIQKAKEVHGDYYDYSLVDYKNNKTPMKIICPIHGIFEQIPSNHLKGRKCLSCFHDSLRTNIGDFITQAKEVHGNKYNYSKSIITNLNNSIKISCPEHGDFKQKGSHHLNGHGCPVCSNCKKLTTEEFINRAEEKHGKKYNYDDVKYINSHTKIRILCMEHGEFMQTPTDHLCGCGCAKCAGLSPITKEIFVERANIIHGNKYNYSNLNMRGMNKKVNIVCDIHGSFEQRAADHLNGCGCPICGTFKQGSYSEKYFEQKPDMKTVQGKLYLVIFNELYCKIGITRNDYLSDRFYGKQYKAVHVEELPLYEAFKIEQEILNSLKEHRYKVKDLVEFKSGWTECFPLSVLGKIKQEINNRVA